MPLPHENKWVAHGSTAPRLIIKWRTDERRRAKSVEPRTSAESGAMFDLLPCLHATRGGGTAHTPSTGSRAN